MYEVWGWLNLVTADVVSSEQLPIKKATVARALYVTFYQREYQLFCFPRSKEKEVPSQKVYNPSSSFVIMFMAPRTWA